MDLTELTGAIQSMNADDAFRARLGPEQWRVFAQYLTQHDLRSGDLLIKQGSSDRTVYFLARGSLQVYVSGAGTAGRVTVLRPGAITGEPGLFVDGPRAANVEAMTSSQVWALRAPRFEELSQRVPALALEILRAAGAVMAVRMRAATAAQIATV